jgi:hemerythrin-like domain-containing protein
VDVLDLLVADHNRVRGLIARYKEAQEDGDSKQSSALAGRILEELKIHMAAEEEVFYESVKQRSEEIGDDVDEGYEEHHVAKVLIGGIEGLELGSDRWVAKMTVLIESTQHHLDEEEEELFPSVRSKSKIEWRRELGAKLDASEVALGATPLEEKLGWRTTDLQEAARRQSIPGRSSMDHDELAATVGSKSN